ncbi:MAG: zinc transporter ZntB, partial [Gammaproteobacteria bacterium]|nr:zinc transporter ZntB [Gammaproteobacteria bacterium]
MTETGETFVYRYLLDRRGGGTEISSEAVENWEPSQGLLWVHLETGNKHGVEWLLQRAGLDPLIAEALSAGETR